MSKQEIFTLSIDDAEIIEFPWGTIRWLCNSNLVPESKQTFGYVTINPGQRNGEHLHPNCEEIIFVAEGECDHYIEDEIVKLKKGDMVFVPEKSDHYAVNTGVEDLVLVVSYSDANRETQAK